MAKLFKKKSKRMTCRKKYKIIKKVAEHHRKVRKEKKKNPTKNKPKDPGVPNSVPFKDKILEEAERRKQRAIELKQLQKEGRLKKHLENRGLTAMVSSAEARSSKFEKNTENVVSEAAGSGNTQSFKTYYREFKQVVDAADVILEVLDARDPLGSRCPQVEQAVIDAGPEKRLVLVLNKIDLIPRTNLENWLKYLKQEFPTVAFKSSTQTQNENLAHSGVAAIHINEKLQLSRRCIGANFLMKLLGNYCRNKNIQTSIKVGIVGFPNVGKSSIINSLKRSRTCTVGATPGVTKSVQEVILDKHIRLLDSPGIVFAKNGSPSMLALRNALKVETLDDVITPVEAILQRASKEQLMTHYCIREFSTPMELLSMLAKRIGRFKKGGIPDPEASARKLLNDWNSGKIKFYTHPPELHTLPTHLSAEFVQEMGKEFDISSLEVEEGMELEKVPVVLPSEGILIKSDGPTEGVNEDAEMDTQTDSTQQNSVTVNFEKKKVKNVPEKENDDISTLNELQQNKARKKAYKKMKKMHKKNEKRATVLSESLSSALSFE